MKLIAPSDKQYKESDLQTETTETSTTVRPRGRGRGKSPTPIELPIGGTYETEGFTAQELWEFNEHKLGKISIQARLSKLTRSGVVEVIGSRKNDKGRPSFVYRVKNNN